MRAALRPLPAGGVFIGFQGAWHLLWALTFTLSMVYQVDVAKLSPLELVLVGTALEVTCFAGEIPTGIVADLRSRKLSVLIGLILIGVGVVIYAAVPSFWPIVLAQVIWGLGYTFVSGAAEAWVTDEVGGANVQPIFTRGLQVGLALDMAGIVLAGLVASGLSSLQAPMVIGGVGFMLLAGVLLVVMQERNFVPVPAAERDTWSGMVHIARTAARAARRPGLVRSLLVIGVLTGLTSEVFDRLWVNRVVNEFGLPDWFGANNLAIWFTLFALVAALISLVASLTVNRFLPRVINAEHPNRVLAVLSACEVLGVAVFAVAPGIGLAMAGVWLREAAGVVGYPIRTAWLNRNVRSESRATIASMMGQADALGQVVGGPVLGGVAGAVGVPAALLVAGAVQLPTAWIYLRLRPEPGPKGHADG